MYKLVAQWVRRLPLICDRILNLMSLSNNFLGIIELLGHCNGGNLNINIWALFGYFICPRRKIRFCLFGKEVKRCLSHANVPAFHEHPDEVTLLTLKAHITKKSYAFVICRNILSLSDKQYRSGSDCSCRNIRIWVHTVFPYT